MPGDPGQAALAGRSVENNQVLPYRPVELGRRVTDSRDRKVARKRGTLGPTQGGPDPATSTWDSPSTLDQITWFTEDATKNYVDPSGKDWTLHDMVVELFKDLQKRQAQASKPKAP